MTHSGDLVLQKWITHVLFAGWYKFWCIVFKYKYFPLFGRFHRTKYAAKNLHFQSFKPASISSFSIIQNEITDEMNRAIWYLVYLQSKPLMQCNVKDWSSNNLKIKREIKFNLFLKSSLIRYVIFLLHVFFMNEKRFPLKISHKFYFNFTVSTEISSQQK